MACLSVSTYPVNLLQANNEQDRFTHFSRLFLCQAPLPLFQYVQLPENGGWPGMLRQLKQHSNV